MTQKERQQAYRTIKLLIQTHTTTFEQQLAIEKAQKSMFQRIEKKYQKSLINQQYSFPRKTDFQDYPSQHHQLVDLNNQTYTLSKPTIKIDKNIHSETQKRTKTQCHHDENNITDPIEANPKHNQFITVTPPIKLISSPLKQNNGFQLEVQAQSLTPNPRKSSDLKLWEQQKQMLLLDKQGVMKHLRNALNSTQKIEMTVNKRNVEAYSLEMRQYSCCKGQH